MQTACGCGTELQGAVEVLDVLAPPGAGYMLECPACGALWAIGISIDVKTILVRKPAPPAEKNGTG